MAIGQNKAQAVLLLVLLGYVSSASLEMQARSMDLADEPKSRQKRFVETTAAIIGAVATIGAAIGGGRDGICSASDCAWGDTYDCHRESNFNYGCKRTDEQKANGEPGYCWSQCSATAVMREWCYTAFRSNSRWMMCTRDSQCKDGAVCGKGYCGGACAAF